MSRSATVVPLPTAGTDLTRGGLSARQARTVQRLTDAALDELRVAGYDGLTVRNVARRAGVAPATAYSYFTSKDHLVTEVFWRRLSSLPETDHDRSGDVTDRLDDALSDLLLLVADEPELASACSIAMLAPDPDVKELRDRVGNEMHRRVAEALGPDGDPLRTTMVDLIVTGALVRVGMGHLSYDELPELVSAVSRLITGSYR